MKTKHLFLITLLLPLNLNAETFDITENPSDYADAIKTKTGGELFVFLSHDCIVDSLVDQSEPIAECSTKSGEQYFSIFVKGPRELRKKIVGNKTNKILIKGIITGTMKTWYIDNRTGKKTNEKEHPIIKITQATETDLPRY